ncbi:MarR family winged helix-turn-helix transcriptional regulator [Streptomyces sp. 4N509B]|uniref:MarR family winged helix-turn-helix transcriptional regulator n=1 Tax=Streptomyces sp. 4N509B TaxID=3457413 RepID=UPI003FD28744
MEGREAGQVTHAVKSAFKAVYASTSRMLEEHGLHFGQHYLLLELWREDGQTVGGLTERLGVEGPTVVRTVRRMQSAGFVRREPDPADRRRVLVFLTERGRELEAVVPAGLESVARQAVAGLTTAEVDALLHTLTRVSSNLTSPPNCSAAPRD